MPTASWPSTHCNTSELFDPQQLVITISLCGKWSVIVQKFTIPSLTVILGQTPEMDQFSEKRALVYVYVFPFVYPWLCLMFEYSTRTT